MSLLGFLVRKKSCSLCQAGLPARELSLIDETLRGELRGGMRLEVCKSCLASKITEYFTNFAFKAVVVRPLERFNAYQAYSLEDMKRYDFDEKSIHYFQGLLASIQGSCSRCSQPANYLWCAPAIYAGDPFEFTYRDDFEKVPLCGQHLAASFVESLQEQGLSFDEFLPPVKGDSFCSSWEA